MIIIDKELEKLEKQNKPIRVGMIGAGFMAKGVAFQIINKTPGMQLAAIANRTTHNAVEIYKESGIQNPTFISTASELDNDINNNKNAYTDNPSLLCESSQIDIILEMTGSLEYGAHVVLEAIKNKKNIVSFNAELDGTLGPILKHHADQQGVTYTLADGDQPGVTMNLYRQVVGMGLKPVLCGNIKGLHDPYRTPTTQQGFAQKWHQRPPMVTSFADGTKISFEQTVIANATGMKVAKRGMNGPVVPTGTLIEEIAKYFPEKDLETSTGIVDYVVGAHPPGGIFVLAKATDRSQKHYLNYYKLGPGPYYTFYIPYHICHFEIPSSIARVALHKDPTITPLNKPMVQVITSAKKNLKKGETLDYLGGYTTYGLCEDYNTTLQQNLLPIGLAEDCVLTKDIKKDEIITFNDVEIDKNKLTYKLWEEQIKKYPLLK